MTAGPGSTLPPWIIVVRHTEDRLFRQLSKAFESDPHVTVIKDRRRAGRRRQSVPVTAERRRTERRTPPPVQDEILWQNLRFRLIHRDPALKVYQAPEAEPAGVTPPAKKAPARRRPARPRTKASTRASAKPARSSRRRRR